jgi:hypothetical protein
LLALGDSLMRLIARMKYFHPDGGSVEKCDGTISRLSGLDGF